VAKPTNGSTETTQTNINTCITTACTTEKNTFKKWEKAIYMYYEQWCSGKYLFGGMHGERGARAYNGGLGADRQSPQRGPGAEPLVRGQEGEAPLKLKRFYVLDMQWKQQTCLTTLCILETE